jgi:hypothetical protein
MRVMCAEKEQNDWDTEEKFLRGCVLGPIINLFPHVQIIVRPSVELEWHSSDPVKHEERSKHIGDIRHGPRRLLGHSGDYIKENLQSSNQN